MQLTQQTNKCESKVIVNAITHPSSPSKIQDSRIRPRPNNKKQTTITHPSSPDVDSPIVAAHSGAVVVDVVELNVVNKLTWSVLKTKEISLYGIVHHIGKETVVIALCAGRHNPQWVVCDMGDLVVADLSENILKRIKI